MKMATLLNWISLYISIYQVFETLLQYESQGLSVSNVSYPVTEGQDPVPVPTPENTDIF